MNLIPQQTTKSRQDREHKCKEKAIELGARLYNCIIALKVTMAQYSNEQGYKSQFKY